MVGEADEPAWYVLYTMPQHEKKVAAYLDQKGIVNYLPLAARKRKWSDRIKIVQFPLFPGYIFVHLLWSRDHISALQHSGALSFVRQQERPAVMSAEEIENLRRFVDAAEEAEASADATFPPGQEIEVRFGPLKGVRGVVQRSGRKGRVFVRVPLLNRMVSAEVDLLDLEPVV